MKPLIITFVFSLLAISAFSQKTCQTFRVEGDPFYSELCGDNWYVAYDLTVCRSAGNANRPFGWIWAFDNGTATDLDTGEIYQLNVHSGWNQNPGKGGREDGFTFHWAGAVAGKIVVQQVIHVNYDGNGMVHQVRKFHVKCL